jgi:hypothetical protein
MKLKCFLFIALLGFIYKLRTIKFKPIDIEPDIIYNTGGYYGFYQLGVCHYIKNHFEYKNKITLGISAGSWLNLFMSLDNNKSQNFLNNVFEKIPSDCPIYKLPKFFKSIIQEYKFEDFDVSKMNIAVTDLDNRKMNIYNNFISLDEIVRCCTASSFIPFITYKDLFFFYKNKLSLDGGLLKRFYLKHINVEKTLIIKFNMFNRFKWYPLLSFIKPKNSFYELYMFGYNDALKNHSHLEKYFIPKN